MAVAPGAAVETLRMEIASRAFWGEAMLIQIFEGDFDTSSDWFWFCVFMSIGGWKVVWIVFGFDVVEVPAVLCQR